MTGLLGGGHAIYYEAAGGRIENLDCFVAVPGLGAERRDAELLELDVPFGAELVHYAVGIASCGVPGVAARPHEVLRRPRPLGRPRPLRPALPPSPAGAEAPSGQPGC